jgi:hypothetical protein
LEARLKKRYEKLVMAHSGNATALSAGVKALIDGSSSFAHTQAMWRFLNNEDVTPQKLSAPLVNACHDALATSEGDYALVVNDWSRIQYGRHTSKKDRLQMSHATDIGYELQSSLMIDAQNGLPLSIVAQNFCSNEGSWQSRKAKIQTEDVNHLDELTERIEWIAEQGLAKKLVYITDREADSVAHLRAWSQAGHLWLVRAKEGGLVRSGESEIALREVADHLTFKEVRQVRCKGHTCSQWIAGTTVVMTRKAKPTKKDKDGVRVKPVKGAPLSVRLVVSRVINADGDVVAQWYLLSNVDEQIDDAQLALWYYFRWEIESFFKLLKSAGHQLESWEQETARGTFNRLLIATQACVMAWQLMRASGEAAAKTRAFLVRLSGRQMKRTQPVTITALLAGVFALLTMIETLEHYSLAELKEFASVAKGAFG